MATEWICDVMDQLGPATDHRFAYIEEQLVGVVGSSARSARTPTGRGQRRCARRSRRRCARPVARRLNRYTCQSCGYSLISEDQDKGVTPFMMPCKCGGDACSHFYKLSADDNAHVLPADIEWYKPTKAEVREMGKDMREHVRLGGLQFKVNSPRAAYLTELLKRGRPPA